MATIEKQKQALDRAVTEAENERKGFFDIMFDELKAAKRSRELQPILYPDVRQETDESKARNRHISRELTRENKEKGGLPMAKGDSYKVVISSGDDVLVTLTTKTRSWAGAIAKIAKENDLACVITVPATVKERIVKIAGID